MDFPKPVSEVTLPAKSTSAATQLSAIESAKRAAAQLAVKEHFNPGARYVGIGSGTTIVYVVEAIKELRDPRVQNILFVPTGYQSRQVQHNFDPNRFFPRSNPLLTGCVCKRKES